MHKDNGTSFSNILSNAKCFLQVNYWIILLFFVSLVLVFKTSDEPLLDFLENTFISNFLYRLEKYNSIFEIIAQGLLTSSIFYFMFISFPFFRQKLFLKKFLFDTYLNTKKRIIRTLYQAVQRHLPNPSIEKKLLTQDGFSEYFDAETDDGSMWRKSLKNIDKYEINDIFHDLNFLKIILNYTLFQLNISTDLHLYQINYFNSEVDKLYYDFQNQTETIDSKRLDFFLYPFLSDMKYSNGNVDRCYFLELIKDL